MNLVEIIQELAAKNVELWVDGDKLRYRAPQDVLTPAILSEIKQYKPEIIQLLQKRAEIAKTYPLSYGQWAFLLFNQMAPDSPVYNIAYAAHLHPDLEIPALQQAFETLIERHSILRTTYTGPDDKPVQQIHEHLKVPLRVQEAFNWSEDDLNNWFAQEVDRPFDLEKGPVLRVNLLIRYFVTDTLSKKKPILLVTIHHIAVDFWSLEIIINELSVLYEAIKTGTQASLPPQSLQYTNYAQWEAQMLAGVSGERLWNYWHQQLAGDLPVLNLPTDRPRPPVQTYNGASYSFELPEQLTHKLKKLTKSNGVTLYIILLAAFQVLLFRYTNTEDILIGTAMAGRSLAEFESIVGYFVNLVVLRADLSENPTFGELLYRVRHNVLGALEHQDYPFSLLVERLQPPRDPSHSPLHQVTFLMEQSRRRQEIEISLDSKLIVESFTPESRGFGLDLGLMIFNVDEGLECFWQYNTDLFDKSTINRMASHFQTLLEGIVANPNQRLWDLPILTVAERHQLLVEWNDTQTEYPQDKCIHQLFEEQVERTKEDAVAVVFEQQLTYQELNCRANKLAHYLKTLGVGPDVVVGIFVERSLEMIVGLLGILKAGGAYLPLDPDHPQERLAFMLDNSQVLVLLTEEKLVARLPEHRAHVVNLDTLDLADESEENLHSSVTSENLAYVIYTSGSTGKPKGVQICHQSVVNFLNSMSKAPKLTEQDILLAVTTITFDIAALELFLPLIVGAKVVLVSREVASDGTQLLEKLIRSNATVMQATPATWRLLLGAGWQNSKQLKILCGGEALPWELASQLLEKGACVWNLYGPTETTIWSAVYEVEASHLVARTKKLQVPIGRPIANTQLYILDAHLQPVPIGVAGELHIGGAGLAKGYLNLPDLTQEKFIPNCFSDEPGARLYKTGDLAHYLPDGNIEFLGRIDNQVKVRGFRIELGEIESVLGQHPAIQETIVLAREDVPGDPRLVAYFVSNQESAPTNTELRRALLQQLPEYMVPSAFVLLDSLPLTPNGKVDRRALPAPSGRAGQELSFVAPRTPIEEMLVVIWAEVLSLELVGVHDNFFELGGHSLLATQLISRLRTTSAVELPLRSLFEHPTVAELAECIQTELLQGQQLLAPPPKAMPRDGKLPLSFAQARLWFLDQLEPGSVFYNMAGAVLLNGELNVAALEQSFNEIIQRHETLRANFISQDGQPVQVIHSAMRLTLPIVDLRSLKESERETEIQRLATQEVQRPFDLANEPLLRVILLVLSEKEHVLLVKTHHIIFDGWSMGVFSQELSVLYSAFCTGQPSPLAKLPIQYADFAVWQREWLQGSVLEAHLSYWKQQLSGAQTVLSLPTDRPRPAFQTYQGAHQFLGMSVDLSEALSKLSRRSGVTLFMTLLAAFGTLLYRYTGQNDILVGSPIANRNHAQIEGLIGFFVNTLVLRTDLSGNPSFQELLARVREMALSAYAHQDVPFEELIEALQLPRDLSHTPLFQVMFILQNAPMLAVEIPSLTASPLAVKNKTAKFDLTLSLENTAQGLQGLLEYNTDLFDAATIARMAEHFQTLLEGIVANPEQRLWDLPLLTAAQRHQLLVEWNTTQVDLPPEASICQLFEAQVERTPDAVAVVFEDQQLTYRELNTRANQLAHYLRTLGVEPDVLVGLCVERSTEMVIGLLGILKAGGAYVPLDPNYPSDRKAYMVSDAQVSVLLTQNNLMSEWEHQANVICLDSDWQEIALYSQSNPTEKATCEDLAYVIYTSGSTGKPKGVMITNGALANFTQTAISEYGITKSDRVLQFASISFDTAVEEIYPCLCAGGTLVLRTSAMLSDLKTFMQKSQQLQLTVIDLPTAYWHQLTMELGSADVVLPESLRLVIIGGERALPQQVRSWLQYLSNVQGEQLPLINTYGPTETTVTATLYRIPSTKTTVECEVPIGRPLPQVQTYILDQHLQPVPVGITGELYIGGAGLARGYLNRPDLTQEKFIPNPFSSKPGARVYKTGDLAHYLPDGNIEFLGRIDNQVKIRGFRIELAEIEAVLAQHLEVRSAVAIAREDQPGNKRLVAYVVPEQESAPTNSELRRFLKQQLPEYMVPSAFVLLDSLPLTPNGKVDRRALPAPEWRPEQELSFVAPRTPIEEMLAVIWAEVLAIELVGVHDNFFELGGHSLLATQLISRVRTTSAVELPLRSLFEHPTVAGLAECIQTELLQGQQLLAPSPKAMPRDGKLPLSFAQARLWFLDKLEPGSVFYNVGGALPLSGKLNVAALEQSLNEIIKRHEALRTNFIIQDGQPIQVIHSAMRLELPIVDLPSISLKEREIDLQQVIQEAQRPFDLANEPLLRVALLVLSETEHVLLLKTHHIIFDGWSMGVFTQELAALYSAFCTGKPSPLAELPIQYADFAVWQREWLQGSVLEAHLSYWKQQLSGAPTVLSLPTDRPRPAIQTYRGAHESLALSVDLSEALSKLSRRSGVTLFMTLLAAFGTLLYRYTGQNDILVGSPIANRNHAQIEGLIGFFVNTLVLRTDLSGNPSFQELLGRVREVALSAYAHQDVPFEELIKALQLPRDLSHTPLFQVMFILQNTPMPMVEMPGLSVSALAVESKMAEFDPTLSLDVEQTAKFDLMLSLSHVNQRLQGVLEYNTDLFDAATIARMAEHFQILLEGIVANPEQRLWDLPLLTAAQRHQLLVEWNTTLTYQPQDAGICQLFEAQVERTPDAVAVVFEDQQLTYQELNSRANQLAHYLRTLGVGPDVLVGLCVERSTEMVIGLLGILKAGGAYVPLDPNYPSDRKAYMVSDAQVSVLLTQNHLVSEWEHQAFVICLDSDWQKIALYSQSNPTEKATCEDLAYVIYTSGSTGKPKGVMISNGASSNFTQTAISEYGITKSDRVLQFASISFDAAVEEIYPCLCAGGTLVLRTSAMLSDLKTFMQKSQQLQLTVIDLPTAYWHQLTMELESADVTLPESLRLVIIGGERALPQHVRSWQQYLRNGKGEQLPLINTYGPTETTVTATLYRIASTWTTVESEVPIGRPLPQVQTYILDQHLQPVPIGVAGELHIGGAGLARGYLNRPDLTQEKFIPNPFSDQPGARLYKTGDLARYLSDGNIEFLGRIDHQVKIRGFRIELPEIESVLSQHPGIKETIVLAREDVPGNPRLVAYFVSNQEPAPTKSDLRQFLKQQLPEYMVPSAFVLLDTLPLTPNGKVDRRALPVPEKATSEAQNAFVAPRDTLELQLAQTWEKILDVSPIGVTDDFFDLGGHSFLAVRLTSEIQKQFGQSLPLTTLFQKATIEQLASILRQQQGFTSWSALVEIQPNGSKRPFFCVHAVGGNVLSYLDLARYLDPDQPFYGLQAKGLDGQHDPYTRVEDMAADYIEALRTVQPQGPYLLGGWSMGGVVAFEMAQQLQRQGHEVARVVLLDSRIPNYADRNSPGNFDETALLNYFAKDLADSFGKNLTVSYNALQQLTLDEQLNYILEQAKMAAIVPSDIGLLEIRPLIKVFKANLQALQSYVPQVYPNRITLFRTSEVLSEDLHSAALGWNELTVEPVDIYTIPGNHYTMLTKPYVQNLSVQLKHCLDDAQATLESSDK